MLLPAPLPRSSAANTYTRTNSKDETASKAGVPSLKQAFYPKTLLFIRVIANYLMQSYVMLGKVIFYY